MANNPQDLVSVTEAAERLGVTRGRVAQLISSGRLPAAKVGHIFVIRVQDLKLVKDRPPGRPSKTKHS